MTDIAADRYENMIGAVLDALASTTMKVRPVCAPQFLRIAAQKGIDRSPWGGGCIAGISYCRIYPTGEVTPCPYLPLSLGNIRETKFSEIWADSPVFRALRDRDTLTGKCGRCEYRGVCGGCRARAYGLTGADHSCGGLSRPEAMEGDYLAEDPWCLYQPEG